MDIKKTKNEQFEELQLNWDINPVSASDCPVDFPLHWHQYAEIIALPYDAVLTRTPSVTIQNVEYPVHPGDIFFSWPGELHSLKNNTDRQLIALQFPTTFISSSTEFVPYVPTFRSIHAISGTENADLAKILHPFLMQTADLKEKAIPFYSAEATICLYRLFITFGTYIRNHRGDLFLPQTDCRARTLEKMQQACLYINENCRQPITLDEIARQFGFSTFYFSRTFKNITGCGFNEYLLMQKIKLAQTYLAETDLKITDIAFLSGFTSITTFNRAFRHFRGCSPSTYRDYHTSD